ncbi:hypothetical protein [Nocardia stercoris]|uniref:hypothetical protein n=1 Tax=Nocardia stercoris TaxID=2483361 RepID=UPI00131A0386|nr:hypothetical protein [Nocardia stercoris]
MGSVGVGSADLALTGVAALVDVEQAIAAVTALGSAATLVPLAAVGSSVTPGPLS